MKNTRILGSDKNAIHQRYIKLNIIHGVCFGLFLSIAFIGYLRNSSVNIYIDMVHEGTHSMDYLRGIKESV